MGNTASRNGTKLTLSPLPQTFFEKAAATPTAAAFLFYDKSAKVWREMPWSEYQRQVCQLAGWLVKEGVKKGDCVAIISSNRPEWMIADLAILSIGAISVPIYSTSTRKDIEYILQHSESQIMFADTRERAAMGSGVGMRAAVTFDEPQGSKLSPVNASRVITLAAALQEPVTAIKQPAKISPNDLATIIYTSGTTGTPKGVMHTHGNLTESMGPVLAVLNEGEKTGTDRFFSFLPLSHVAERILVQLGSIYSGSEVAFARSVDTLGEDLVACRPTILLCVPRLWEKIYEKIRNGLKTASPVKRGVFALAIKLGSSRISGRDIFRNRNNSISAKISDVLVGKKLRDKLGMDKTRLLLTGSAPTRPDVMKFFASFGLLIREVYGLTENLCLGTFNEHEHIVIGSCGRLFDGNEIKIADDQEIMFRASWMFKGYYKNPEATAEALSKDGWFATGDLGVYDTKTGLLSIVGRKKELLKTSNGKYVAPVPIEDKLKSNTLITDAMVVGDNEKFCIALVALDPEQTKNGEREAKISELKQHLAETNQNLPNHEQVRRIGILKHGFSVEAGTLTPSLKLKRKFALETNKDFARRVYESSEVVMFE